MATSRSNVWDVWHQLTNFANNTESVDSNGEESLSEDNADDESDAENIEVSVVSDDEVDDNDLTVAEDDDQVEDADTVIWSEVEQNLNVEELRERTGPQVMLPMDAK